MSTLRVTNIEAKGDPSSPSVDEKLKLTNSTGDIVLEVDGKNVGAGQTVFVGSGIVTATTVSATTVSVAGSITATNLYGDASSLTGIDATALKSGGVVKVQANSSGSVTTGVSTVTSQIVVGDSFIKSGSVGLGSTNTAGRDAGISTAVGTMIYNIQTSKIEVWTGSKWAYANLSVPSNATGGDIVGSYNGKAIHVFTTSGTFTNNEVSPLTIEYIAIAGGGGGGGAARGAGGGGAGGVLTNISGLMPTVTPIAAVGPAVSYTVTIGGGGSGGAGPNGIGGNGVDTTITGPGPFTLRAAGGGRGNVALTGGSGIGGSAGGSGDGVGGAPGNSPESSGNQFNPGSPAFPGPAPGQGNDSGGGHHQAGVYSAGGGGGGAGSAGQWAGPLGPIAGGGNGGDGIILPATYQDPAASYGNPGPSGGNFWYAGGGGGGNNLGSAGIGEGGGGGGPYAGAGNGGDTGPPDSGSNPATGFDALANSGSGGGGGGGYQTPTATGGAGGSGIVFISYPT
jgi:hypothetical protein